MPTARLLSIAIASLPDPTKLQITYTYAFDTAPTSKLTNTIEFNLGQDADDMLTQMGDAVDAALE